MRKRRKESFHLSISLSLSVLFTYPVLLSSGVENYSRPHILCHAHKHMHLIILQRKGDTVWLSLPHTSSPLKANDAKVAKSLYTFRSSFTFTVVRKQGELVFGLAHNMGQKQKQKQITNYHYRTSNEWHVEQRL